MTRPRWPPTCRQRESGVDDTLGTPYTQDLELVNTGAIVLDSGQDGRYVLTILAATPENLAATVYKLITGEYRGALVSDFAGVQQFRGVSE